MKQFLKTAKGRAVMISAAILLIVILLFLTLGGEAAYRSISISEISGTVVAENNGNSYEAYKNMVIGGGYSLTTNAESYTRMLLDSDKYMKLEERSCARFESLGSPTEHRTAIRLDYGALSTEITAPLSGDEDFVVNTPNAVLAVRGTFFRVEVSFDTNGDAYTDVYTYGGAVACRRVMPNGTVVDENVVVDTGYKARIKMDEIITIYVEELIEETSDNVDPLEMNDIQNGQLVDVYNASVHGHEMFRSTKAFWDEIVEREIDIKDYASAYDGKEIPPYAEEDAETTETFVTTSVPETSETAPASETSETAPASETSETSPAPATAGRMDFPNDTGMRQPESSLLPGTTGSAPITTVASVPPAVTTAEQTSSELFPETDSTAAPTGNVAAETAGTDPIGTSAATPAGTSGSAGKPAVTTVPSETTVPTSVKTTESPEETEETEGSASTAAAAETVTTTAWENTAPSAEIVTRPLAFTTSRAPIPAVTTISMQPSHVHTPVEETVAASCTENGAVRTKCSVCGVIISETVISAPGHNTGRVTVAATCDADGERLDVCKLCGVIVSRAVIPATGHITDTTTIAATCVRNGERTEKCRICGTVLSAAILPAAGHTRITETAEATCTASGSTTVKCSVCGEIFSREIVPATGHIMDTAIVAATCERDGERTEKCRICGTVLSTAVIPAAGHTQVTETVEATCTASGLTTVKCSVCGKILSMESIPVTAHIAETATVAATCEENGERTEKCRICGTVLSTAVIPAAGHTQVTETVEATCTASGFTTVKCSVCGKILSLESIPVTAHIADITTVAATCEENGERAEKCRICGTVLSTTVIPAAGHSYEATETKPASCTEEGEEAEICTVCGQEKPDSAVAIPKLPHTEVTESDGSVETVKCAVCGEIISRTVLINDASFPDETLRNYIFDNFDTDESGSLSETELSQITEIAVSGEVGSLKGIELLPALESVRATVHIEDGVIAIADVGGIDPGKVSGVSGGKYDESAGTISEIAEDTEVTLNYTPEGGKSVTVTLIPDETSTFWTETPEGIAINAENFPDKKFREYVSTNFDKDTDGYLSETEIAAVTEITVSGTSSTDGGVTSLKGIEYFTRLTLLWCYYNSGLTELDVSQNTALETLRCEDTNLTALDISNNTMLTGLNCSDTQITLLDVSNNTTLKELWCKNTQITSLDVSNNTTLSFLFCYSTQITSLDLSQNTALTQLNCNSSRLAYVDVSNKPYLSTFNASDNEHPITVINGSFDTHTIDGFDPTRVSDVVGAEWDEATGVFSNIAEGTTTITYTYDCDGVGGHNATFTLVPDENSTFEPETPEGIAINAENFPDEVFRNYVSENFDSDTNGYLSEAEIAAVTRIDVGGPSFEDGGITSLKGVEYFSGLTVLRCNNNNGLTSLDASNNTALTQLTCFGTQITSLDVSHNMALTALSCGGTQITSLDVRANTALTDLRCSGTQITSLDVSQNTSLEKLYCYDTPITSLNVSNNTALEFLWCTNTQIIELDVSQNTALTQLLCYNTQITEIDVSKNTALETLWCYNSRLAYVDVSNNPSLSNFDTYSNEHPITVINGSFDTHTIDGFDPTRVSEVVGAEWDEATGVFSKIAEGTTEITYTYDCDGTSGHNVTFTLVPDENSTFEPETPEGIAINAENFPDEVFRNYVLENFDTDSNGELSQAEIAAVTSINVSGIYPTDGGVTSMKGVEYFTKLADLRCQYNKSLTELDVSQNTALEMLGCYSTQITELDVSQNTALTSLSCSDTSITSLDVSNNTTLAWLDCCDIQITELNVSNNVALETLRCIDTQITELDVSKNTALKTLLCDYSRLAYIDISNNPSLSDFLAIGNKHPITVTNGTFDTHTIDGFDPTRVSDVVGADWDETTGVFSNISEETNITYIYNCGQRKSETFTLVPDENSTFEPETPEGIAVNAENFPDEVFRNYVLENFDTDTNGYLSETEIAAVKTIDVSGTLTKDGRVTSLKGVEYFTGLTELDCSYNSGLTELDVSQNTALKGLDCSCTKIASLDVRQNTALMDLGCHDTQITSLDVRQNTTLYSLWCSNCRLTSIDIRNNTLLDFFASGNQYVIPSNATMFDSVSDLNFQLSGFNPNRVSNVVGANFSPESGIFDNFTSDTITYTYDCDGAGGHNVTFTLVRSDEAVGASIYSEDDTPENYAVFPSDNTTNTPPGASDADIPVSGEGAFPSGGAELFSLLPPVGLLALAHSRKRKTAFRFAQKAEIN